MINFDGHTLPNLETARSHEWLETNGIGGFSSSTITGLNTRRYHGLLTAATKPPVGRLVLLSKLEETLVINGRRYELSTNQYPGAVHPRRRKNWGQAFDLCDSQRVKLFGPRNSSYLWHAKLIAYRVKLFAFKDQ